MRLDIGSRSTREAVKFHL